MRHKWGMSDISYLTTQAGYKLAYCQTPGKSPGVVFMSGFRSDMSGTKATAIEAFCRERGQAFLRFDYSGHGASGGEFEKGTIGTWAQDAITLIDEVTQGPQILIGSSMGGWIMLLAALARPERVAGLVGIAAAPDFTTKLMWEYATPEQRRIIEEQGVYYAPSDYGDPYPITRELIEESKQHLLLDSEIAIDCPVRLVHGMADKDVPWEFSCRIAQRIEGENVQVRLIKDGGHRLSEPEQLRVIQEALVELLPVIL
jgi:pimeloyl-ACP methyl ester carboxylesterase